MHADSVLDKKLREKHKFYIFDNMATYIEEFVYDLYLGEFRCVSFHSSGDWKVKARTHICIYIYIYMHTHTYINRYIYTNYNANSS